MACCNQRKQHILNMSVVVLLSLTLLCSCMEARSLPVDGSTLVKKKVDDDGKKYKEKIIALWGNIKHSGPSPGVGHSYVDSTMPLKTQQPWSVLIVQYTNCKWTQLANYFVFSFFLINKITSYFHPNVSNAVFSFLSLYLFTSQLYTTIRPNT